jgi:hypothetical protein
VEVCRPTEADAESLCSLCESHVSKGSFWPAIAAPFVSPARTSTTSRSYLGDAALTRRARKYSTLAAVALKWSRARKRHERQGLPVEEQALQRAEAECLNDAEGGQGAADREAERRAELDATCTCRAIPRSTGRNSPTG